MPRKPYPKRGSIREFILMAISSNTSACLHWPYATDLKGYGVGDFDGKRWRITRLVCHTVHGPSPSKNHEAAHSCGRPSCVNPKHLRWATPFENSQDKYLHNTVLRGEQIARAKLTADNIRQIRLLRQTATCAAIAKQFHVSESNISAVISGKTWGWVD